MSTVLVVTIALVAWAAALTGGICLCVAAAWGDEASERERARKARLRLVHSSDWSVR